MTRFAKVSWMGALGLLLASSPAYASTLCIIELIGYTHYYWYPPGGSCALATYNIAIDHCGNVWDNTWIATTQAYEPKAASPSRTYEFTCTDGEVSWFGW
jgi:hypothetical protein